MTRLPLIVNPSAGRRGADAARIAAVFARAGVDVDARAVPPDRLERAVRAALEGGAPAIAVAGGDGTLRTAAEVLAGTGAALLPVPAGTLNHFARRMGIGTVASAARAAAGGRTVSVALGAAGDAVFLNTFTCGLYAPVIRRREALRARWGRWGGAVLAAWSALRDLPPLDAAVAADGRVHRGPFVLAWAGMGRDSFPHAWDAPAGTRAETLELVLVRARRGGPVRGVPWREMVRAARTAGTTDPDAAVAVLHVPGFRVDALGGLDVTLDGEARSLDPPLAVSVRPAALRVVVPAEAGAGIPTNSDPPEGAKRR